MIKEILSEQLEEMSVMGGSGAGTSGNVEIGGSKPDKKKDDDEDEDEVKEAKYHPSELPISNPRGASTITVRMIGSSRHRPTGVGSDAAYKKAVSNKFKYDTRYANAKAPYYEEGDIITDLVEKVLRNIVRSN